MELYLFGAALAMTISWSAHHKLGWAIVHGLFSWVYVIYFRVCLWIAMNHGN